MDNRLDWEALIETALTVPGNLHGVYDRFYQYSYGNHILLMQQGVTEPVATYEGWKKVGRQVLKFSKAKEIIRPVILEKKNEAGEVESRSVRFKTVRAIFALSDTVGDELPPVETPSWNRERALATLAIQQVPFEHIDGNVGGYSSGRDVAISPVAPYPTKTLFHELAHVVAGHTGETEQADYVQHRGLKEFEAEGSAYLAMNELELMTDDQADVSRAYVQSWLRSEEPPERSIRTIFKVTDTILKAGRESV